MNKQPPPTINNALLYDVLLEATAFPEVHEQGVWGMRTTCGTAYCVAGMANAFEGVAMRFIEASECSYQDYGAISEVCGEPVGLGSDVESNARVLLGLTWGQAELFFNEENTIDELWDIAHEYTNGAVTRPPETVIAEYRLMGSRIKKIDAEHFPTHAPA